MRRFRNAHRFLRKAKRNGSLKRVTQAAPEPSITSPKEKSDQLTPQDIAQIIEEFNKENLHGIKALAFIITLTRAAKKRHGHKDSLFGRVTEAMEKRVLEQMLVSTMLAKINEKKTEMLENLLAEQEFKISLNSNDSTERALAKFCEDQDNQIQDMRDTIFQSM